ncbi:MAG TPA: cation:proton antiporter [Vicinamibacterales bacterium]|nr:cation:proton antiporter [Vicinamibacterales bacterium]
MPETGLILTLAGGLGAALIGGYLTQRLGLSPIVGYLMAGVVVGPYTPGYTADVHLAEQLAEVGVILLMFGVGLQFHLDELLAVRRVAIPGAVLQSLVATVLGAFAARGLGWDWPAAIVFGLSLSVASTVVLVRVLSDSRQLHTSTGHIAVGWLVVEDVFTVIVLVLLPALAGSPSPQTVAISLGVTILKVVGLGIVAAVIGSRVIPVILDHVAATRSRELFTLAVLALALGLAVSAAAVFGVSMALGAFLAGMIVGRSDYSLRAATDALPMRDAFAVLFFVSVGMLLRPAALLDQPVFVLAALLIVLVGKPVTAALVTWLMKYPLRTTLGVSVSLAQVGEFSFMLVTIGRSLDVVPPEALDVVVATAIISITLNPLAFKTIEPLTRRLGQLRVFREVLEPLDLGATSSLDPGGRAIVIGHGPTGRTVTRLLRENGISPTVVELNIDVVRQLREQGLSAVYGDASHTDTLISAGLPHASTLIVSGADTGSPNIIQCARSINPTAHIFVRSQYLRDVPPLRNAGAEQVFAGEGEVALAMTEAVLRRLGATPDQIDRERARVREELMPADRESA